MEFLDKAGVTTLWNKIKSLISQETSKYLPLDGGGRDIKTKIGLMQTYTTTYSGTGVVAKVIQF